MDKETKMGFSMFALTGAIFAGVGYMATGQSNSSLVVTAIVLLGAAVLFWLWIRRDENAAAAANKTLDNAERTARDASRSLRVPIQSIEEDPKADASVAVKTAPPAMEPVPPVLENIPPEPPTIEPPQPPTINPPQPPVIEPPSAPSREPSKPPTITPPEPPTINPPGAPDIQPPTPPTINPPTGKVKIEVGDVAGDDDLTRIEGIGPRFRDILVAAGIKTFADLAGTTEAHLTEVIREAGARKPGSVGTWARQAEMAAKGDWEKLDEFQKTLSGGRAKKD